MQSLTLRHLENGTYGFNKNGVALKNFDGRMGTMTIEDAALGRWIVRDNKDGEVSQFGSLDELIVCGWALD